MIDVALPTNLPLTPGQEKQYEKRYVSTVCKAVKPGHGKIKKIAIYVDPGAKWRLAPIEGALNQSTKNA